jgi:hypothetical protein
MDGLSQIKREAIKASSQPIRCVRVFLELVRMSHRAARYYHASFPGIFLRALGLLLGKGFFAHDAFVLGLLDPSLSQGELSNYVSRHVMTRIQESVNPPSWTVLTEDKGIFYRYCMSNRISIPKLYAIFFKKAAGWSHNGSVLGDSADWSRFLVQEVPVESVIKPARGAYGRKVEILRRSGEYFSNHFGEVFGAEELYERMRSDSEYDSFIVQERLGNHPDLVRLSDTPCLQTVRMITFVDRDMNCHILDTIFKIIVGGNIIDNFEFGLTGNMLSEVSLREGVLKNAFSVHPDIPGLRPIYVHPQSGICLDGFQLPFWEDACNLVKDAAAKFFPIRTIGWDLAITPKGAVIVEGNSYYDPHSANKYMKTIVDTILSG